MQKEKDVDLEVLLLLIGIIIIIKYIVDLSISDLIYGCLLIYYHIRIKYFADKESL